MERMTMSTDDTSTLTHHLQHDEARALQLLRALRQRRRGETGRPQQAHFTVGQRIADMVAAAMGSWPFIIIQSVVLLCWITLNVAAYMEHWDPYPFILLNLGLSFQAAYAAPFIMMSQNRQQAVDRAEAANDYQINIKAELEIELLHQKIDALRNEEILALSEAVRSLTALLQEAIALQKK